MNWFLNSSKLLSINSGRNIKSSSDPRNLNVDILDDLSFKNLSGSSPEKQLSKSSKNFLGLFFSMNFNSTNLPSSIIKSFSTCSEALLQIELAT